MGVKRAVFRVIMDKITEKAAGCLAITDEIKYLKLANDNLKCKQVLIIGA